MGISTKKRSIMILYSSSLDLESHRVRIVLAEKGIPVDIIEIDRYGKQEDLFELNPYNTTPTLVDRELVLYNSNIIMEYLDERFPHPPLLPIYPVTRAKFRLMIFRMDQDWYPLVKTIQTGKPQEQESARLKLQNGLLSILPLFNEYEYLLSDTFSLIDCCFAPLLWRLPSLGVELSPKHAKALIDYSKKIFQRETFQKSLTEPELELCRKK
ncbi:MAG: glutathione S-transferase N-terminal domain-containing protein [Gammaproteobacteria bacterium]|nr:glutathione S-transferase N-terminal domain-containing protein [Gammaproteobacteria bacterium]